MNRIIFITILIFAFCAAAFAQADKDVCPTIKISVPDFLNLNEAGVVSAEVGEEVKKYNVEYVWTVEDGKILEGQGTRKIKVLRETAGGNVILKITGLPPNCSNAASKNFNKLTFDVFPFDRLYNLSLNDEKGRFDNLFVNVRNDKDNQAIVIFELDKRTSNAKKRKRLGELSKHFNLRKIDKSRFTFIVYESDEQQTIFWIMPKNTNFEDILYFDNKDYKVIKGEEFQPKKIDELFPKK